MVSRVLVTGGCGFFGAWIVKQLLEEGVDVTVFDMDLMTKRWEMVMTTEQIARIKFVKGRVDEADLLTAIVDTQPDAVIHLAGLQVPACRDNPVLGAKVNVIGTLNVFEAAKVLKTKSAKVPNIVYASSAAVFGPDAEYGETAVGDLSVPKPTSHYGAYKLCIEYCAKSYWIANQVGSIGLRPLTVYGPGRDTGLTSFPTRAIAAAVKGQSFDIPFTGATAYIHIREIADMFVKCAQIASNDAKVYTIGGDTVDTATFISELEAHLPGASRLLTCSGGSLPIASKMDDSALRHDFPGVIRIALAQGIAETVAIYKALEQAGKLTV